MKVNRLKEEHNFNEISPKDPKMNVDKTRNMEHSGTSRNIPEHPGTWNSYHNYEKK